MHIDYMLMLYMINIVQSIHKYTTELQKEKKTTSTTLHIQTLLISGT